MSTGKDVATATQHEVAKPSQPLTVVTPAVDILENDHEILVHAEMPGVLKDDIMIHIDNGKLFVSGERKRVSPGTSAWQEFGNVEFRRTFAIPQTIDVEKVQAQLKDGVLELQGDQREKVLGLLSGLGWDVKISGG